jgi:hypothetical protein
MQAIQGETQVQFGVHVYYPLFRKISFLTLIMSLPLLYIFVNNRILIQHIALASNGVTKTLSKSFIA